MKKWKQFLKGNTIASMATRKESLINGNNSSFICFSFELQIREKESFMWSGTNLRFSCFIISKANFEALYIKKNNDYKIQNKNYTEGFPSNILSVANEFTKNEREEFFVLDKKKEKEESNWREESIDSMVGGSITTSSTIKRKS